MGRATGNQASVQVPFSLALAMAPRTPRRLMLRMPEALTRRVDPTVLLRNVEALLEQVRVETTLGPAVGVGNVVSDHHFLTGQLANAAHGECFPWFV